MSWTQIVKPNVEINENAGWCLQYARRAFGADAVETSAWAGWMSTEHPHEDRNWPSGVAVPVWFDWTGDVGSGRFRYGHVAVRTADGKIWSSPLSGYGRAWFNSVDDLVRAFGGGMRYVGWSEDISDVRVVKKGTEVIGNKNHVEILFRQFFGRSATATEKERFAKNTLEYALNNGLYKYRKDLPSVLKQLASLKQQVQVGDLSQAEIDKVIKEAEEALAAAKALKE